MKERANSLLPINLWNWPEWKWANLGRKEYSFLGIFNSIRIQHFCSEATYRKVGKASQRQQGELDRRGRGPGNWNYSTFLLQTGWSWTSSLNAVSNFLCCKRKQSHEIVFWNQNKHQSRCKITWHVVNIQEWLFHKRWEFCPVRYVRKNNALFYPIKSLESHLTRYLKLLKNLWCTRKKSMMIFPLLFPGQDR